MNTPSKNFNYNSPYATPVQNYPSQSLDYISLDMGGPMEQKNAAFSEKTPGFNTPKYYQQNYKNSNSKANRQNSFYNNHGQRNNRQTFYQQKRCGPRKSNERGQQHNNDIKDTDIASYLHSSMTEDPWLELVQRMHGIGKSKISLNDTSTSKGESLSTTDTSLNSVSDSDQADDNAISD